MPNHRAYAKINLGLRVLRKRPDGYHDISTVFHRIDLFDELEFSPSPSIQVVSSSPEAPGEEANTCYTAAKLLREYLGVSDGVRISLRKNIPVGAGLGGGSSDAALVLKELPGFWKRSVDEKTIQSLALGLGSDVPYFLRPGSAVGTGRGEELEYFQLDIPYAVLLCNPRIHVSTAWAYRHITPTASSHDPGLKTVVTECMRNPERLGSLRNDFEPVVFRQFPEIARVKKMMLECGAVFALMSGSGSSVYGLFPSESRATEASAVLEKKGYFTSITRPGF